MVRSRFAEPFRGSGTHIYALYPHTARIFAEKREISAVHGSDACGDDIRQALVRGIRAMEGILHEREGVGRVGLWGGGWSRRGTLALCEETGGREEVLGRATDLRAQACQAVASGRECAPTERGVRPERRGDGPARGVALPTG